MVAGVTAFFALPAHCYIAGRSQHGGGSTAPLERVISGWFGKPLLLVLLVSFKGCTRNFVRLAVLTACLYPAVTLCVVGSGAAYLAEHPELFEVWWNDVWAGGWKPGTAARPAGNRGRWSARAFRSCRRCVWPQRLRADPHGDTARPRSCRRRPREPPGVIRNTRVLLAAAAVTMSGYLLLSALITTVLIAPAAQDATGLAKYRALAYLAHGGALADGRPATAMSPAFGPVFGAASPRSRSLPWRGRASRWRSRRGFRRT
ncbi:MAG: hypothetical protein J0I06_17575 [Planctomycetes bacterium]|nr:hypothetical protein [Planctomycetota bacterium]